jgi:hypothetical protein
MMNRLYLVSSLFFTAGAFLALRETLSAINCMYLMGSLFFFLAALTGIVGKSR